MSRFDIPKPEVMRNLQWESEERRKMEFRIAAHYMHDTVDVYIPTKHRAFQYRDPETGQKLDRLTYRFSKDKNGVIYAHAAGKVLGADGVTVEREEGILGKGSFGSVVLAERLDKSLWAVKEARFDRETGREAVVVDDLGLLGSVLRGKTTVTTTYRYLGVSLKTYLEKNPDLEEEERFLIVVKMFRAVERLHSGAASRTGKKYVHLDLKLENFTIDEKGDVHLIDFGFTTENPREMMSTHLGDALHVIPDFEYWKYTRENMDVFAFMRCLYFPPEVKHLGKRPAGGFELCISKRNDYRDFLFTDAMAKKEPFSQILGQTDLGEFKPPRNVLPSLRELSERIRQAGLWLEDVSLRVSNALNPYGLEASPYIRNALRFVSELEGCIAVLRKAALSDKTIVEKVLFDIPAYYRHFGVLNDHDCVTKENIQKIFDSSEPFERCVHFLIQAHLLNQSNLQSVLNKIELFDHCFVLLNRNHFLTQEDVTVVLNQPERFHRCVTLLLSQGMSESESVNSVLRLNESDFDLFYKAVAEIKKYPNLNIGANISKIRDASDKKTETVLIFLEAGLNAAKEKTSDTVKKRLYDEFSTADKSDLNFFVEKCARILSHHTNIFKSRSSEKETAAFSAAKDYLESARQLLGISDERWRAILKDKPDDKKGQVKRRVTYDFFKKEKKTSEIMGRDVGISGADLDGGSPGSGGAFESQSEVWSKKSS